ncbi:Zinc finger, CCHC-type superfamily [Sesbania bispinosa]|nr:Zinc finger, CCHC-type superfamily [Sesbania bispinosa]
MDFNSDDSAVNFEDDRDVSYSESSSSDEMSSENDIHSVEENVSNVQAEADMDDENDVMDTDVREDVSMRIIDLTRADILALDFSTENDAFNFYFSYARCHGFAIRKDDRIRDSEGMVIMRQYLCSRAGLRDKKHLIRLDRKKEHIPLTRTNCLAKLRVRFDYKSAKFKVVSFEDSHNHDLTPAKFVPLIPAYRGLTNGDKAQVDALHSHGVRPCQITGFLVDQKGGYRNVGFSKKDLYNYIDEVMRGKIKDGDAVDGLSYLQGKADNNPMMFSEAMFNKHPTAVVTNGDGAMRDAIKVVFPNACHRLCGWHLNKNACENVKNPKFLDDFKKAMYSNFTPNQFEEFWEEMVSKHGLQGNRWVMKTYDMKEMWATAYLRDKFFARIRTTSQCEGINSLIKAYVRSKNTIIEFIHNFENSLREYKYKELSSDFNSLYFEPVLTTSLQKIERQASKVFTLDIFKDVKYEIERAGALNVMERSLEGDNVVFKLNEYYGLDEVEPDMMMVCRFVVANSHWAPMKKRKRRKSKRCSNCKISGHVITTCPSLVLPEDDEVNINDEDYGPESQSLRRDAAQNHDGVSSDENFPDSSSNHVSRSISQSMENRSSTDKRTFQKKKMKSLSQISDTQEEVKPIPTECKANEVLNGPHKVGGETAGPSSTTKQEVQEGDFVNRPDQNGTFRSSYPNPVSAPFFSYQLPIVGPSSVGNIQIREGTEDGSRPGVWNDLLQEVIRKSVGPGENTGKNDEIIVRLLI